MHAWIERRLRRFNDWFSDAGGVWQTFLICLVIVCLEATHVIPDDHGFWLLYWLTVYSAVTQPALAYAGRLTGQRLEELLLRLLLSEEHLEALAEKIAEKLIQG
jgi:hypothetical protein